MKLTNLDLQTPIRVVVAEDFPLLDLVTVLTRRDYSDIELIIPQTEVRHVKDSFPLNAKLSSLVEQNDLTIYQTDARTIQTVILDDATAYCSLEVGTVSEFVNVESESVQTALDTEYASILEGAEILELDIVGWEKLLDQLEATVGADTRREFERLIQAARLEHLGALDEYAVAIIAAAQCEALQHDLGTWSEDVGLASKATFSRRKTTLEDQGIIYTEKVPVEVGRPKHRLQLSPDIDTVKVQGGTLDYSRQTASEEPQESTSSTNERKSHSRSVDASGPVEYQPDSESQLTKIEEEVRQAISDN